MRSIQQRTQIAGTISPMVDAGRRPLVRRTAWARRSRSPRGSRRLSRDAGAGQGAWPSFRWSEPPLSSSNSYWGISEKFVHCA